MSFGKLFYLTCLKIIGFQSTNENYWKKNAFSMDWWNIKVICNITASIRNISHESSLKFNFETFVATYETAQAQLLEGSL